MKTVFTFISILLCINIYSQRSLSGCIFKNPNDSLIQITSKIDSNGWIFFKKIPIFSLWDLNSSETTDFLGIDINTTFKAYQETERTNRDSIQYKNVKYKQYYKNIPVECGELFEHWEDCFLININGNMVCDIDIDTNGILNSTSVIQYALDYYNSDEYLWEDTLAENELKEFRNNQSETYYPKPKLLINCEKELVYRFFITSKTPYFTKEVEVNAKSGDIVKEKVPIINCGLASKLPNYEPNLLKYVQDNSQEQILNEDNITTDFTTYGSTLDNGVQAMTTTYSSGTHKLITNHYSFKVETRDLEFGSDAMEWDDFKIHTMSGINSTTWPTDIVKITNDHWAINKAIQYFMDVHSSWLFAGSGLKVYSNGGTFLGTGYNYDNDYIVIFIEPPYGYFGRLDVLGHEVAHKYIITFSGLKDGSAIAESFADIYGTMVERYVLGNLNYDWEICDKCINVSTGIRSLSNPPEHDACLDGGNGDPDTYLGPGWEDGSGCEPSGTHINCGVHNKFFYLLAEGGLHNGINVVGIGVDKALEIADYTLVNYINLSTDFVTLRNSEVEAARVLFGECSLEHRMTQTAWEACGIGTVNNCYELNGSLTICSDKRNLPINVTLENQGNFTPNLIWVPLKVDIDFGPIHIHTDPTNWDYDISGSYNNTLTINDIPNHTVPGIYFFAVFDLYGYSEIIMFQVIDCPGIISDDPPTTTNALDCNLFNIHESRINKKIDDILFPNPSNLEIVISNAKNSSYIIYNFENKIVQSGNIINDDSKINIEALIPGVYFINIQTNDNQQKNYKFIKI